ncbi:MAG TPA: S8 family serine peptidase, partial [Gemmatimonadaceae bacterium]|nr:S8 family serine peptidase [Gemmatimonadaceae bacterium]
MKYPARIAALVVANLAIGGCAAPRPRVAPEPAPAAAPVTPPASVAPPAASTPAKAPAASSAPPPAAPPARVLTEAPRDWQLLDAATDGVPGTSTRRAVRDLLAGRQPQRTVVVAVIDGGVDTAHVALRGALWGNPKEVAGNGKDDDGNGYADDTRGWNFLGGANGENVNWDTLELTREHVRCTRISPPASTTAVPDSVRARCAELAKEFEAKRTELQQMAAQITMVEGMYGRTVRILGTVLPADSLTEARVRALTPLADSVRQARDLFLRMASAGITGDAIRDGKEDVKGQLEYGLNPDFDPRKIVGDDPSNVNERRYGNRDVTGPDAKHGTHVAGIIAAMRDSASGVEGIGAGALVKIMAVRAVPNGDEHDKDIANAIRYAVDNGAQIINMSFGKGFSP